MKYEQGAMRLIGGLVSYIDNTGKKITPSIYTSGTSFNNGFAFVKFNDQFGFINSEGKTVLDYQFEEGNNFFRGIAYIKKNNHWEYINTNGNKIW